MWILSAHLFELVNMDGGFYSTKLFYFISCCYTSNLISLIIILKISRQDLSIVKYIILIWYDIVISCDMSKSKKGLNMHQIYHNNIIRCLCLNCRKRASNTLRQVVHAGNISSILQITQILTIVYSSIIIFTCTLMVPFLKLFLPFIYYAFVWKYFSNPFVYHFCTS